MIFLVIDLFKHCVCSDAHFAVYVIIKYVLRRFDLLSKVATKYTASVTDKLSKLESMEQDLNNTARALAQAVDEVNSSARKAQERLERHCSGEYSLN